MKRNKSFIVIEGGDGSGKATQTRRLKRRFEKSGKKVKTIAFPRHGTTAGALVDWYLDGWITDKADKADPRLAQSYYFYDQWMAQVQIKRWLKQGYVVIADRYCTSGKGHQLGKLNTTKQRREFLKWSNDLTYKRLDFVLAVKVIYLDTSLSRAAVHKHVQRVRQGVKKKDLHERDPEHLRKAAAGYHWVIKNDKYDKWKLINCMRGSKMRSIEEIHKDVWREVRR